MSNKIIFGSPEASEVISKDRLLEKAIEHTATEGANTVAEQIMQLVLVDYADHLRPRYENAVEYDSLWYKDMVKGIARILVEAQLNRIWPDTFYEE